MPLVKTDVYTWHVIYSDGSQAGEYDDERPDGRGWAEVQPDQDEKTIERIALIPTGERLAHVVTIPNGAPVFFRRRRIGIDPIIGTQEDIGTVHCIGWGDDPAFDTVGQAYLFIFEDGSCFLSNDRQAI